MAQTGFTPIKIYASSTATSVPSPSNLDNTNGAELAINITDGKLFYKDNVGAVQVIASKSAAINVASISFGSTGLTPSTASTGVVTVSGILAPSNGGTGISSLGTGVGTFLNSPSSSTLAAIIPDKTGSGALVFATSPTLVTPNLGTPSAGVVTNLTGTASININGTVGATTPSTGSFTSLAYSTTLTGGTGIVNLGSGQFYKDASGYVGINTSSPGSSLDVKGTVRLSGATSGYVGLSPAAAAGSTTYTLPNADGSTGQALTTNGAGSLSWSSSGGFPAGTAMMFAQTAAPTGWTKSTTHNNKALRVVSGTAGSGGTVAFTTAFASQTPAGTIGSTTLVESQIPSHTHVEQVWANIKNGTRYPNSTSAYGGTSATAATSSLTTAATGGNGSHNHTFTGTAIDLTVQYVDVIIATKD